MGLAGQFGGRAPASIYKTLGSILVSGNRRNKTKPKIQLVESHWWFDEGKFIVSKNTS